MEYYILNINFEKKNKVDHWIEKRKIAPIFYGQSTLAQIYSGCCPEISDVGFRDASNFCQTFKSISKNSIIISIGDEWLYIYRQKNKLLEWEKIGNDLVKGFEIDLIKKVKISSCPLILITIKANRHLGSGTFKQIKGDNSYLGNRKAIEYLMTGKRVYVDSYKSYLRCLSSLEFETLIAKYLEEKGFFVRAYKGGYIRNFDLFCTNISSGIISIGNNSFLPNKTISIQIKLTLDKKDFSKITDLYFCIDSNALMSDKILDSNFLFKEVKLCPITEKWLSHSLDWVNMKNCT